MNHRSWIRACTFTLISAGILVGHAGAGSDADLFLEMLNGAAQGMASGERFAECLNGDRANWARCDREMKEEQNRYSDQVQRRTAERERRDRLREEREAMTECEQEQDPDRYAKCVKALSK
jgi:hypothetical protein